MKRASAAIAVACFGLLLVVGPGVLAQDPTPTPWPTAYVPAGAVGTALYERWPIGAVGIVRDAVGTLFPSDVTAVPISYSFGFDDIMGTPVPTLPGGIEPGQNPLWELTDCGGNACYRYVGGAPPPVGDGYGQLTAKGINQTFHAGITYNHKWYLPDGAVASAFRSLSGFRSAFDTSFMHAWDPTPRANSSGGWITQVATVGQGSSDMFIEGVSVALAQTPVPGGAAVYMDPYMLLKEKGAGTAFVVPLVPNVPDSVPTWTAVPGLPQPTRYNAWSDYDFELEVPEEAGSFFRLMSRVASLFTFVVFAVAKLRGLIAHGS